MSSDHALSRSLYNHMESEREVQKDLATLPAIKTGTYLVVRQSVAERI